MSRGSAREKILDTASGLFAEHGFRAVGVDTIVEQSGVAKMSLYRHFPSKDDLITAYLHTIEHGVEGGFEATVAAHPDNPRAAILAIFEDMAQGAGALAFAGCTFQAASAEFPELSHPAHQTAVGHKQHVLVLLNRLTAQAGAANPGALADQLFLLMEGTLASVRVFGGTPNPAQSLVSAVQVLLDASLPKAE